MENLQRDGDDGFARVSALTQAEGTDSSDSVQCHLRLRNLVRFHTFLEGWDSRMRPYLGSVS